MRKIRRIIIIYMIFMTTHLVAQVDYSKIDFNFMGVGAKSLALGNAHIAGTSDEIAIYWNPAGLAKLKDFAHTSFTGMLQMSNYQGGESVDWAKQHNANFATINFFGLGSSLRILNFPVGFALGYYKVVNFYQLTNDKKQAYRATSKGGVDVISPGFAFPICPNITIGLAFNRYFGKYKFDDSNCVDFNHTFSGHNFSFGTQYEYSRGTVGAVLKTPFTLEIAQKDSTILLQMPLFVGVGATYQLRQHINILMDYEIRLFSNSQGTDSRGNILKVRTNGSDEPENWINWKNCSILSAGIEYSLKYKKIDLPLRCGFARRPLALIDANDKQINSWAVTAGFGIYTDNIHIDLGAEYLFKKWDERLSSEETDTLGENSFTVLASIAIVWRDY